METNNKNNRIKSIKRTRHLLECLGIEIIKDHLELCYKHTNFKSLEEFYFESINIRESYETEILASKILKYFSDFYKLCGQLQSYIVFIATGITDERRIKIFNDNKGILKDIFKNLHCDYFTIVQKFFDKFNLDNIKVKCYEEKQQDKKNNISYIKISCDEVLNSNKMVKLLQQIIGIRNNDVHNWCDIKFFSNRMVMLVNDNGTFLCYDKNGIVSVKEMIFECEKYIEDLLNEISNVQEAINCHNEIFFMKDHVSMYVIIENNNNYYQCEMPVTYKRNYDIGQILISNEIKDKLHSKGYQIIDNIYNIYEMQAIDTLELNKLFDLKTTMPKYNSSIEFRFYPKIIEDVDLIELINNLSCDSEYLIKKKLFEKLINENSTKPELSTEVENYLNDWITENKENCVIFLFNTGKVRIFDNLITVMNFMKGKKVIPNEKIKNAFSLMLDMIINDKYYDEKEKDNLLFRTCMFMLKYDDFDIKNFFFGKNFKIKKQLIRIYFNKKLLTDEEISFFTNNVTECKDKIIDLCNNNIENKNSNFNEKINFTKLRKFLLLC